MKSIILITAVAILAPFTLQAQENEDRPERKRKGPLPPHIVEKFDTNGDGKLSKEERQAARAAKKAKMLEKFDTNGDGQLSDSERQAAREARREKRQARRNEREGQRDE